MWRDAEFVSCPVAETLALTPPDSFRYLQQSTCSTDQTLHDHSTFHDVLVRTTTQLLLAASVSSQR